MIRQESCFSKYILLCLLDVLKVLFEYPVIEEDTYGSNSAYTPHEGLNLSLEEPEVQCIWPEVGGSDSLFVLLF